MSVPKYTSSPPIKIFRTFYIPNLIPVTIILIDLNLLRTNSLNISHLLVQNFNLSHLLILYFDFSKMSDPVVHDLLLRTLNDCRLLPGYTNWWNNYFTYRLLDICYCEALPATQEVLSGVPLRIFLEQHLSKFCINYFCSVVRNLNVLLFADEIEMFHYMSPYVEIHLLGFYHKLCESSVTLTEAIEEMGQPIDTIEQFYIMWITYLPQI